MRTLLFLLRKEFLQIRRDHAMLRLLVLMPIVQLLVLSSAATFEVREARMYVVDEDRSRVSRGLVERMVASGRFVPVPGAASMRLAGEALLDRDASLILHLPHGLERDLVRAGAGEVQLVFDAEDGAAAGVLRAYATQIVARYAAELGRELRPAVRSVRGGPAPPAAAAPFVDLRTRGWFNAELDYRDHMVPGILVILVTIVATTVGSMNIVREKELGTLEQLNVTPISKGQFVASKLIPFWLIAVADLTLGLVVARLVFDVPMRGSLPLVFGAAGVYLLVALAIGLWISTVAETQQQAMFVSYAVNLVYLLMSGLFTPVGSMPGWAQWIAELSPVKHFIVIMRAVLVKGADLADIRLPLAVLVVHGVVVLTLAVRQYSKTSG
jgi:ABC-2 type transport system permease protein